VQRPVPALKTVQPQARAFESPGRQEYAGQQQARIPAVPRFAPARNQSGNTPVDR
jgi:hypothetical protein